MVDFMKPILYEQTETAFTSQGIGVLADALFCVITEELNDQFDLEMRYPVTGVHYKDITLRRIIKAKPNQTDEAQPFRIYKISKPMSGVVTIHAHHISYDLSGLVVPPFNVNTTAGVIAAITATAVPTIDPFTFSNTSTATSKDVVVEKPISARAALSEMLKASSVELSYNKWNIAVSNQRGSDKGAVIAYGKNLIDVQQEENCTEVCTGVYPFFHTDESNVTLTERYISLPGTFDFERIIPLDCTSFFEEYAVPTENELRTAAQTYIAENNLGVPKVSLTIKYVSIEDSDEAIPLHMFEGIALGDPVTVKFEKLGIDAKSRCIRYDYNVLEDRTDSITIGDPKETFTDTVTKTVNRDMSDVVMTALAKATSLITNGLGGYVRFHKSSPSLSSPDELLILGDSPDLDQATQVWRWNKNGLMYSDHGYNPPQAYPYKTAITNDGKIVADMITTGILSAIEINNGNGTFHVTSDGEVTATSGQIGGFNIDSNSLYNNCVQLHNTGGIRVLNNGRVVGRIGAVGTNRDVFGIILDNAGESLIWAVTDANGNEVPILRYVKASNQIDVLTRLNMRGNYIANADIPTDIWATVDTSYIVINHHPSDSSLYILSLYNKGIHYNSQGQFVGDTGYVKVGDYTIRKA